MTEHVFIVGGTSGIGLAAAAKLTRLGYRATIAGRDRAKLEAARHSLGDVGAVVMDAADPVAVKAAFAGAGPIDHCVLALGSGKGAGPLRRRRDRMRCGGLRGEDAAAHRLRPGRPADIAQRRKPDLHLRRVGLRGVAGHRRSRCGECRGRGAGSGPRRRIAAAARQRRRARRHRHAMVGLSARRSAQDGVRRLTPPGRRSAGSAGPRMSPTPSPSSSVTDL